MLRDHVALGVVDDAVEPERVVADLPGIDDDIATVIGTVDIDVDLRVRDVRLNQQPAIGVVLELEIRPFRRIGSPLENRGVEPRAPVIEFVVGQCASSN